jgi:hypothetical protein
MQVGTVVAGKDGLDGFREAFEAADAADQDVADAAGLQVGQHLHPELRAPLSWNHMPSTSRSPSIVIANAS